MPRTRGEVSELRFLITPLAAGIAVVVLLAVSFLEAPDNASASHAGGADFFLIDMDTTGNSGTAISAVESCARVNENNLLDADEAAIDTLQVDAVMANLQVGVRDVAYTFNFPGGDTAFIVTQIATPFASENGWWILNASDSDPQTDGTFLHVIVDALLTGNIGTGSGSLGRMTMETMSGVQSGVFPLFLTDAESEPFPPPGVPFVYPDNQIPGVRRLVPDAKVAVNVPCPAPVDVEVTDAFISGPSLVATGIPFDVTVDITVRNNTDTPVDVDVLASFWLCGDWFHLEIPLTLPAFTSVDLSPQVFTQTCVVPNEYVVNAVVGVNVDGNQPDSVPANNTAHAPLLAIEAIDDADGDWVADAVDNCPNVPNPWQENNSQPGTTAGDHCEDLDLDGVSDAFDNCYSTPNSAQEDMDGDDIGDLCDACQVTPDSAENDVDLDCVSDGSNNCPEVSNDEQDDADGDTIGDACDTGDTDVDSIDDATEYHCGSPRDDGSLLPERVDGPFTGTNDDGDRLVDEGLPAAAAGFDCDGDGYTGTRENNAYSYVGQTDGDQKTCQEYDLSHPNPNADIKPSLRWPSDFNRYEGVLDSFNRIDVLDLTSFMAPVRYIGTDVGTNPGDVRWDLRPGPEIFGTDINVADLTALIAPGASTGAPPMLGGVRAMGGPVCPWPP